MPQDLQTILYGNTVAASNSGGTAVTSAPNAGSTKTNPKDSSSALIDAITQRLTQQGKGISSSSSSNLQSSINDAITSAQTAGDKSSAALQLERQREVAYAKGQASNTLTGALEGQNGYAQQVAGLEQLTETTTKSVKDLDQRYQQALLSNDAATAKNISDLTVKKLEFQQTQEQNFYTNLFSAANISMQQKGQQMQQEQFWSKQDSDQKQFVAQLAQSSYQFNKNLAIQMQDMDLKKQQLLLDADRNNISRMEANARIKELQKGSDTLATQGMLQTQILNTLQTGGTLGTPLEDATQAYAQFVQSNPNFKMDQNEFNTVYMTARTNALAGWKTTPPPASTAPVGGLFGQGGSATPIGTGMSTASGLIHEGLFGNVPGQASTASQVDWTQFLKNMTGYGYTAVNPAMGAAFNYATK